MDTGPDTDTARNGAGQGQIKALDVDTGLDTTARRRAAKRTPTQRAAHAEWARGRYWKDPEGMARKKREWRAGLPADVRELSNARRRANRAALPKSIRDAAAKARRELEREQRATETPAEAATRRAAARDATARYRARRRAALEAPE